MAKTTTTTKTLSLKEDGLSNAKLGLMTLAVFVFYIIFSFISKGFYQHDEIGHYFNMREFWHNPNVILGNWPKTGYKLFYALPSLLGNQFLVFFNAAITSFTCFLAYKTARLIGSRYALLAFFMLALQPFWIQLSFRDYADPFSGFVLLSALYFHFKEKFILSAIILSFSAIIRQEFLLLLVPYGVWFLLNKRFIPFLLLATFPFLNNIWGFMVTGELFYLVTSSAKTAAKYGDEWPRQGFDHYFVMSITIWGAVQTALIVVYIIQGITRRMKKFDEHAFAVEYPEMATNKGKSPVFIFTIFMVYFFIHCFFNWESFKVGASTGGNLRYMTAIAPIVALLSAIACDRMKFVTSKMLFFVGFAIYTILVGIFATYHHNNVVFITAESNPDEFAKVGRDYAPLLFTIFFIAILFMVTKPKQQSMAYLILASLFTLFSVRPFKLTPEDMTMEKVTNSLISQHYAETRPLYVNHTLFKYFYDKKKKGVYDKQFYLDSLSVEKAEVGSIMFWESHYGYRPKMNPNAINLDYFSRRPDKYKVLQSHISTDQRFQAVVLEKISK